MASAAVLARVQQRALQAEQIITRLRDQLETIKKAAIASSSEKQAVILTAENAQLRLEVEALKQKMVQAEIANGLKQVPLPSSVLCNKTSAPAGAPVVAPGKAAPGDSAGTTGNNDQPKKEGEKQGKKNKKEGKAKEKKDKPAQAAAELPVDISRLDLRVGRIVSAKHHPDADSLYIEDVDVGEGNNRTILSGLVKHVPLDQMQNRLAVFMCNLKPAKMRGIMSQGMIMCASTPEKVEILNVPEGCQPGDRVAFEGYDGTPDVQLNPKKKVWETVAPDLKVDDTGVATYKGVPMKVVGKGTCVAPTLKNVPIK